MKGHPKYPQNWRTIHTQSYEIMLQLLIEPCMTSTVSAQVTFISYLFLLPSLFVRVKGPKLALAGLLRPEPTLQYVSMVSFLMVDAKEPVTF